MKKNYFLLLLICIFSNNYAQLLLQENFNFTGSLNGQNAWTNHSGTVSQTLLDTGTLTYPNLSNTLGNKMFTSAANSEDLNKAISPGQTGDVYFSVLIKFKSLTGINTTGDYGMHFVTSVPPPTNGYIGRLFWRLNATGTGINFGVLNISGGTGTVPTYSSQDILVGQTAFVVLKINTNTKIASIFVNPEPGSSEPIIASASSNMGTGAFSAVGGIAIRQAGNMTTGTGEEYIDEIRVGKNWGSVTSNTMAIKEISKSDFFLKENFVDQTLFFNKSNQAQVFIYNLSGQLVKKDNITSDHYNVSDLVKGTYILKLKTNLDVFISKFIKK